MTRVMRRLDFSDVFKERASARLADAVTILKRWFSGQKPRKVDGEPTGTRLPRQCEPDVHGETAGGLPQSGGLARHAAAKASPLERAKLL